MTASLSKKAKKERRKGDRFIFIENKSVPFFRPNLEPFTKAYPDYGTGGARQLIPKPGTTTIIKADEVTILPEK